jgi:peroxisomal 2,4-dienoyl-CoA reductase
MARLSTPEMREKLKQMIPLGRLGTIRDIEQTAVFLCSDAASFINGHVVVVDGGLWLLGTRLG